MYKKIHLILFFFAFLSNAVTAQSNGDDDSVLESAMWNACTSCNGVQFYSCTGADFLQYGCQQNGDQATCATAGVVTVGQYGDKSCAEVYCAQFANANDCNAATNVQGTKLSCSWSSSASLCNLSIWSAIKSFMIPIIVILCLCIVGCIVACVFMARKKKRTGGERQQETVIIQGGQTTPYAQMNDVVTVNSQI